jgi:phosphonate transport system substrate-binding protein
MTVKILPIVLLTLSITIAVGQTPETVEFFLTPSVSEQLLKEKGVYIKEFLEKETGIKIELKIPKSYDELVDDFGRQSKCFGFMSSQSYVIANDKHKAMVKLRAVRFGHSVYQGMIVTHASSGIKTLNDLAGKTIAYTDELSTSGYLYPKKLLEKVNVKPGKVVFLKKHDEVVKQVYERKVDAGAAFYSPASAEGELRDARGRIATQFPDVEKKVIILVKTNPIPNDPIVFSKGFDVASSNKICVAIMKLSKDEKGRQALLDIYGAEAFVRASDADYNSLRQAMGLSNK